MTGPVDRPGGFGSGSCVPGPWTGSPSHMTDQPATGHDVTAADLDADIEVPNDPPVASSDPDAFTDDGLGTGDGPDLQAPEDSGS